MTKFMYVCLFVGAFALYGCAEQEAESLPQAAEAAEEVVEISEEDLDILDATADTMAVDLGEINEDNYEEALEKLEQAVDSE